MSKWWPFTKSKQVDAEKYFLQAEKTLRQRFDQALAAGTGRQAILAMIEAESNALEAKAQTPDVKATLRAYDLLYSEIRPRMLGNLSEGKAHEMAGRIENAVALYEKAVADQVPTRFPFEHLRVIYRRRQQYDEALRVCNTAVSNPYLTSKDHEHFRNWATKFAKIINGE